MKLFQTNLIVLLFLLPIFLFAQGGEINDFFVVHGSTEHEEFSEKDFPLLKLESDGENIIFQAWVKQPGMEPSENFTGGIDLWLDFRGPDDGIGFQFIEFEGELYLIDGQADLDAFWDEIQNPIIEDWSFGKMRINEIGANEIIDRDLEEIPFWQEGDIPPQKVIIPMGIVKYRLLIDENGKVKVGSGWENVGEYLEDDKLEAQAGGDNEMRKLVIHHQLIPGISALRPDLVETELEIQDHGYWMRAKFPTKSLGFVPAGGIEKLWAKAEVHIRPNDFPSYDHLILSTTEKNGPYSVSDGFGVPLLIPIKPDFFPGSNTLYSTETNEQDSPWPQFFQFQGDKWQGWRQEISEVGSGVRYHSWQSRFATVSFLEETVETRDTSVGKSRFSRSQFDFPDEKPFLDRSGFDYPEEESPEPVALSANGKSYLCQAIYNLFNYPDGVPGAWVMNWSYTYGVRGSGMCGSDIGVRHRLLRFDKDDIKQYDLASHQTCWGRWVAGGLSDEDWNKGLEDVEGFDSVSLENVTWVKKGREMEVKLSDGRGFLAKWNRKKKEWEFVKQ